MQSDIPERKTQALEKEGRGDNPAGVCVFLKEKPSGMFSLSPSALPHLHGIVCVSFLVDSCCLHFNSQPGGSPSVVDEFINGQLSCVYNIVGSVEDYRLLWHCFILNAE